MKEAMKLAAKVVLILSIILLFILFNFLISMKFTSSENIVIDQYDGRVAFCSTSSDIASQDKSLEIEVNNIKYQGIKITEVIQTDTFVGADRVYIYCTNISGIGKGNIATLYIKYSSLIDYVLTNYLPEK